MSQLIGIDKKNAPYLVERLDCGEVLLEESLAHRPGQLLGSLEKNFDESLMTALSLGTTLLQETKLGSEQFVHV